MNNLPSQDTKIKDRTPLEILHDGAMLPRKKEKEKNKGGRPRMYTEKTKSLSVQVPISHYDRLKSILDYELDKLKIKKVQEITLTREALDELIKSGIEKATKNNK